MATQEITISELELADEILGDMNIPVDTATETRAVTLKQLRAWLGSALPIGSIFASVGRIDDERFTLLDGKTISRTGTYEAFCNKVVEKVQAGTWTACTEEEFNLELSETGQCGKFVVSNDYVRIPKLGNSLCSGVIDGKIAVVGNGMTLGLTNGTDIGGLSTFATGNGWGFGASGGAYGTPVKRSSDASGGSGYYGITTDPTKSGIEGKINSVEVFYYMVISTEGQTASVEIDINKVYEDLNIKANTSLSNVASNIDYVVESYNDGTNWYRVYKSGWIEQGGITSGVSATTTVNFLKSYSITPSVVCTEYLDYDTTNQTIIKQISLSNFVLHNDHTTTHTVRATWYACGQGA